MKYNATLAAVRNDWSALATGESGNVETERLFLLEMQAAYRKFTKKHHDYGHNNLSRSWVNGIVVRVGDKLSRLENALRSGNTLKVADESLVDTSLDSANYFIIGSLMLKGLWPEYDRKNAASVHMCTDCPLACKE